MRCFPPEVVGFLQQCIELGFTLIFEVIPVEELSCLLIEPGGLCSCEWSYYLEHQLTLSPQHLRGNTQVCYLKCGLVFQTIW